MKYFVILLFLVGLGEMAFAEEIPIQVQTPNDTDLIITGSVDYPPIGETPLTMIIIEDEMGNPILVESVNSNKTGFFSLELKRIGPLWENVKEFSVRAINTDAMSSNVVIPESDPDVLNLGKITWEEAAYTGFENTVGQIQVIDPDVNQFYNVIDFLRVHVWSDSSPNGTTVTLTETGMNTSIFEVDVIFSNKYHYSRGVVFVSNGDTVTATYTDTTLPEDMESDIHNVNATALIVGKRGPPMERAPASNLQILSIDNKPITNEKILVNQQIRLVADLENHQNKTQPFAYLVQIQNNQNQVESLSWLTGNLTSFQKLSPGVTWIPFKEGEYAATVFVWESVQNPTALSPPLSMDLSVK